MVATGIELTWGLIVTAALLDSINPCVFVVLIFLIAFMKKAFRNPNKMLIGGLVYTTVVYLTYLLLGLGILKFTVSFGFSRIFYWIAALIAIGAGLLEIKDYFWYVQGLTYLLVYNLVFILPLLIIIGLAYFGTSSKELEKWRKEHRGLMRLIIGLFLVALGAYMIYTIS